MPDEPASEDSGRSAAGWRLAQRLLRALPRSAALGLGFLLFAWLVGFCAELLVDVVLDHQETYPTPRPDVSGLGLLVGAVVGAVLFGLGLVASVIPANGAEKAQTSKPVQGRERRPTTAAPRLPDTVDDIPVSSVVADALHGAARQLPLGAELSTGRVLALLTRLDYGLDWQRIWLVTGAPEQVGLASAADSTPPAGAQPHRTTWRNIRLSPELAEAFEVARAVRNRYAHPAVDTGVFTLGLLAFRNAGATRALLSLGQVDHGQLLRHVQDDILRTRLRGLRSIIPAAPN